MTRFYNGRSAGRANVSTGNSMKKIVDEKLNKEKLLAQLPKVKPITVPPLSGKKFEFPK
jgi:hypothetical protein